MLSFAIAALALPLASEFSAWKAEFKKAYDTVEAEAAALSAYEANDAIIREHNAKKLSYWLGHNEFSDLTWDQFNAYYMESSTALHMNRAPTNMQRAHIQLPKPVSTVEDDDSVDWVEKGAVTPVKNQGRCGSCWAFSTTGSTEGAFFVASGKLVSLSEEDLVQCDTNKDQGCHGGLMDNAFAYIEKNGIATEADYPYTSGTGEGGTCMKPKQLKKAVTISGFKDVPADDEDALKDAVTKGPVSIAIEADKSAFQLYKGGVLDSATCGKKLDHGVLVVGYGTDSDSSKDFWKVKNSWGATWGEQGFVRLVRGKNMCGVASSASYPTGATAAGPSPPPGPDPPSPPSPPGPKTHYGDPKNGCLQDELEVSISGISGDFCTPHCAIFKGCPSDVPDGVTARPQCALQDAKTNQKFCALICSPSLPILDQTAADAQCGENASCKGVQAGIGICTYDD